MKAEIQMLRKSQKEIRDGSHVAKLEEKSQIDFLMPDEIWTVLIMGFFVCESVYPV